jgi:hypothetical protein
MPDQETLAFFIGTFSLFGLLCLLFLGAQWRVLCLLYRPLPPQEPQEEDMYNDPTQEVRAIR